MCFSVCICVFVYVHLYVCMCLCVTLCVCICLDGWGDNTIQSPPTYSKQFPWFRPAVKPEESQYTEIDLTDNPSYESVGGKPHKQGGVCESVDTYY